MASAVKAGETGIVTQCPACGQYNRIPYRRLGSDANCGKCKTGIPSPNSPVEVETEDAFGRMVAESVLPIIVDFWAPWCGPCRSVAPEFDKVAEAAAGAYLVAKVNTEALPLLGASQRVESIPTMIVFNGGREIARTVGARPASAIRSFAKQVLTI